MRLGANVIVLFVTLLIATSAMGGKSRKNRRGKNDTESGRPTIVVAVVNLKVDSEKDNVKGKIEELTAKLRDKVSEHAQKFEVVSSRQTRIIRKRNRKAIASCYDDCDVEFGLLAKANFVIGGHLEPSTGGIIATLEIRNTQSREVVSSKRISGANYFELESAMMSSVRRFVKPLNNVVFQATDTEVLKDAPEESDEQEQDVTGLGSSSDSVASGATQADSDYIAQKEEDDEPRDWGRLDEMWNEAKDESPFMSDGDLGFEKENGPGIFGVGINGGYSFNVARAKHLRHLYKPVFHLGAQLQARLHHLFEIAIVADIDYLKSGSTWRDNRFGTPNMNEATTDDISALQNVHRVNDYDSGSYLTVGIRPTARLVIPINLLEFFVGVGIGFNYVKTSGYWHTYAEGNEYVKDLGVPPIPVKIEVAYDFTTTHFGFYGLIESALIVRAFSDRLGVGALFQFKMPATWRKGTKTDTKITQIQNTPGHAANQENGTGNAFGNPSESDVRNSPIGHVDALNLLTLGLIADWRF